MLPVAVFLVALALSACTEKHWFAEDIDPRASLGCNQYTYRGSECGISIAARKEYGSKKGFADYHEKDGICPTYSTGYYCCSQFYKQFDFKPDNFDSWRHVDCVKQECEYNPDMTADEAAEKEKAHNEYGMEMKCVKISTGLEQPPNRIDCNGKNPTKAPTTLRPSFSPGPIKKYSNEQCSLEVSLRVMIQLPEEASKKGGNCAALKEMARKSFSSGTTKKPRTRYSTDDIATALCDCASGVLSEEDLKLYNCVLGGENMAKILTECKAEDNVLDTIFGLFPEGGKLWLFITVIVAVFVLILCLFICCSCSRKK